MPDGLIRWSLRTLRLAALSPQVPAHGHTH